MPNLTLTENIYNTEYRSLSMTEKFNIAFGIACGMRHLHKNHIIHRDLKPDNVLIDHDMHPRISDFGLSKFLEKGYASTAAKGTPAYMAPEVISGDEYTYSADVYSYGILINELFSAKKPFSDAPTLFALFNRVLDNQRPEITSNTPPQFASLIKDCWCSEPNKRPSFDQIVERLQRDDFILDGIDQKDVSSYRSIANVV
ncbi:hypothetical protein TRFO_21385 [Tritrichomonas foetus]|uniref:Protein kinase domain-containing protein n=1 Tax=Tritrichomonas foetus TaxID=1144522 RepID=A0A1J4KE04_9EUKA|nr:hypothetical protein TRFO_21385 [Tritrichomonas foetus]|eukprot:OHT09665.1 hypothetical protein TRFO_21385 [Tritrichomonas foetus]